MPHQLRRLPITLLALAIGAVLQGFFTFRAGTLIAGEQQPKTRVIECVGFPGEGVRKSTSQIRLVNLSGYRANLEINFLDVDGTVLRTRQVDLTSRATASLEVATWQVGSALQVTTLTPVSVDVTLVYDGSVGPPERRTVPCWRSAFPQSTAGVLHPS
jgi:hypothetical protein